MKIYKTYSMLTKDIFPKLECKVLPQVCDCDDIVYLIPGLITEEPVWFEYRQNLGYSVAYSTEPEVWVAYKITKSSNILIKKSTNTFFDANV